MSDRFSQIDDLRQQAKVNYPLHDCLMNGCAMIFFKDPSLFASQQRIQDQMHRNHLTWVFGVNTIPKDSQRREVLNGLDPKILDPVVTDFVHRLQRGKQLDPYQLLSGSYLICLDGSEYFSSESVHCPHCLVTRPKKGTVHYHHQILQPVLIHPQKSKCFH